MIGPNFLIRFINKKLKSNNQIKTIPDADLSSAGDDFHILWTMKKSFELLNFDDLGLKAIYIEGIERKLEQKTDPTGEKLLGIDLTEYYGSKEFESCNKVVISQLKYSTRRTNEDYTFSKLYSSKKKNSTDGSLIHRLANVYKTFLLEYGRDLVLEKIEIKLVSNRKFNSSQIKLIDKIKSYLERNKRKISFNKVLKDNSIDLKYLKKLQKASRLTLTEFSDFFRLLNFDDCGVNSRYNLNVELIRSISETCITTSKKQYNELFQLIWNKIMPESRNHRRITVTDLIASLGFLSGGIENLFPVTQNFENREFTVEREQLREILSSINENKNYYPICLHGKAGIGKSTIVRQINKSIPSYSECIIFDCYGAGAYQNSEDKRHLHKYALVHLANEIAKRLGSDFLINRDEAKEVYLKEFKKRVTAGIDILRKRNPRASLTLIIDAADNSITAAKNMGEDSFVKDLLNLDIPIGLNLIVTSRTYRKESLKLPDNYIDIELNPFSLNESTLFIKSYFPHIKKLDINEFHNYTNGIPRAQFYSIDLKKQGIKEIINFLKPNGKTVEDLILGKIEEAKRKVGSNEKLIIDKFFQLLITLPRPVPISYLSTLLDVNFRFLEDISSEIWNGLIYENKHFEFRDEDFENYVREKYSPNDKRLLDLSSTFLDKATNDEYAATNLGYILFISERYDELKRIVLEREYLSIIKNPIRAREIYINRTKLAMKVSGKNEDNLSFFKLTMIAAEESKTDKALTTLLIDYPDLVTHFGNDVSLKNLKLNSDQKSWAGSFHLKLAGYLSRNSSNHKAAIKHLETAKDWLNWRFHEKKSDSETDYENKYLISTIDISYETEAILRVFGVNKSIQSLNRWSPENTRILAGNQLINNILNLDKSEQISIWLDEGNFRLDVKIFLICKLFEFQKDVHFNLNEIADELILKWKGKLNFQPYFELYLMQFCEILANQKIEKNKILTIISKINYTLPKSIPYFNDHFEEQDNKGNMIIALKAEALKKSLNNNKLSVDHICPEKFDKIDKIEDYNKRISTERDKKEFISFFTYAVSVFQLRANILCKNINATEAEKEINNICTTYNSEYDFQYTHRHNYKKRVDFLVSQLTEIIGYLNKGELIHEILGCFDRNYSKVELRFAILEKIIHLIPFSEVNLYLLKEVDDIIKDDALSSNEMVDYYVKCALYGNKIDLVIGQYYFTKAIEAINEIDYEAFAKIKCLYELSTKGITKSNPKLAYEYARFVEYCDTKLGDFDKKNFPYADAIKGIANIDTPSVFSTVCRWHHRSIIDLPIYIITILERALNAGYINHLQASSLIPLYCFDHHSEDLITFYKSILLLFDKHSDQVNKTKFIENLYRNSRLTEDKAIISAIYQEIKSGKFISNKIISEIENYLEFLSKIDDKEQTNYKNEYKIEERKNYIDVNLINSTSIKDLEHSLSRIIDQSEKYTNRNEIDNFLFDIKKHCSPQNYVSHLNALISLDSNLLNFYSFEKALKERLIDWRIHPGVENWKKEKFKFVILKWFDHLNEYSLSTGRISEFATFFDYNEEELADILLSIIPEKFELLSDESLYGAFVLIKSRLSKGENEKLIKWTLDRWNKNISPKFADGLWNDKLIPPANSDLVLGNFLKFILGQPDKRLRWRAIHSIRRLANYGDLNIIRFLISNQNNRNCFPFQNNNYMFYWISSKLYLWIAIEKISTENPKAIISFKNELMNELLYKELPHILIKFYVKRTCLNILEYDRSVFNDGEIKIINDSLETKFEKVSEERLNREQRKYKSNSSKGWKFKFDSIDVLPYWYGGLARIFNLSEFDVADLAERHIVEKWGYTGDVNQDDYTGNFDWELKDKRHGSNPIVEDLSTYFEYHSLYCAATDLLNNEPQLESETEGIWGTWKYWIESQASTWDKYWISDLRDPIPLEIKYWKNEYEKINENWRDSIIEEKFDNEIGYKILFDDKFIIPHGGYQRYLGHNTESVHIRSALISKKGEYAILRALQTASNHHDYAFPIDNNGEHLEIDELGFKMNCWLKYTKTEYDGLDEHDYLTQDIGKSIVTLSDNIQFHYPVKISDDLKNTFLDGKLITNLTTWNNIRDLNHRSSDLIESGGEIFKVELDFILNILKKTGKSMLIKCMISRQLKEKNYDFSYDSRPGDHVKLYLLKEDGTVTTIRGKSFKIR